MNVCQTCRSVRNCLRHRDYPFRPFFSPWRSHYTIHSHSLCLKVYFKYRNRRTWESKPGSPLLSNVSYGDLSQNQLNIEQWIAFKRRALIGPFKLRESFAIQLQATRARFASVNFEMVARMNVFELKSYFGDELFHCFSIFKNNCPPQFRCLAVHINLAALWLCGSVTNVSSC